VCTVFLRDRGLEVVVSDQYRTLLVGALLICGSRCLASGPACIAVGALQVQRWGVCCLMSGLSREVAVGFGGSGADLGCGCERTR
jgi:hypothetical protein